MTSPNKPQIENPNVAHDMALVMDQERDAERIWRQGGRESQLRKANELAAAATAIEAAYRSQLDAPREASPITDAEVTAITVPKSYKLSGEDHPTEQPQDTQADQGEKERRTERLREIVSDGEFNATVWMSGTGKAPREMGGGQYSRFQQFHSNPESAPFLADFTSNDTKALFAAEGVSQLLTAEKLNIGFGRFNKDTDKPEEPAFLMTFETVANQLGQFVYRDKTGRTGNLFRYNLLLSSSAAQEFMQYAQEDPIVLQEVGDIIMREELQAGQDWEDARPPYDEWKTQMGGVVKTALRYDLEAGPAESKIISVAS